MERAACLGVLARLTTAIPSTHRGTIGFLRANTIALLALGCFACPRRRRRMPGCRLHRLLLLGFFRFTLRRWRWGWRWILCSSLSQHYCATWVGETRDIAAKGKTDGNQECEQGYQYLAHRTCPPTKRRSIAPIISSNHLGCKTRIGWTIACWPAAADAFANR